MKKDLLTGKSGKIGLIIKALLLFAAVFAAAVMFFALIMYIFAAGFKYSALFATLSAASGAFAAAFYLSGKNGSRGWLTGAAVGGIVFCVLTLISLMINRGGLTVSFGKITITSIACALILGIITNVILGRKKKAE